MHINEALTRAKPSGKKPLVKGFSLNLDSLCERVQLSAFDYAAEASFYAATAHYSKRGGGSFQMQLF